MFNVTNKSFYFFETPVFDETGSFFSFLFFWVFVAVLPACLFSSFVGMFTALGTASILGETRPAAPSTSSGAGGAARASFFARRLLFRRAPIAAMTELITCVVNAVTTLAIACFL